MDTDFEYHDALWIFEGDSLAVLDGQTERDNTLDFVLCAPHTLWNGDRYQLFRLAGGSILLRCNYWKTLRAVHPSNTR